MKEVECCDMWQTKAPTSEPVSKFAKLISVCSKVRLTAASILSAGMPKPINKEMWKSRAYLKGCLLQGLHSPKLETRVLVFAHLPDRSTCPVSGILLPGMLMEFLFAVCLLKEQKQTRNNSESSRSRQHLSHRTRRTANICSPLACVASVLLAQSATATHKNNKMQLPPIAL